MKVGRSDTLRSSSVIGPVCSGGSADDGDGELDGDGTSSGSSTLPRDQSSSVVSLGTPSLPVGPLSLTDLRISGSCVASVTGSNHRVPVVATSDAELELRCNLFTSSSRTLSQNITTVSGVSSERKLRFSYVYLYDLSDRPSRNNYLNNSIERTEYTQQSIE